MVRNRVRRRLRAVLAERRRTGGLPAGAYLVIVRPAAADRTQAELEGSLEQVMQRISSKARNEEGRGA